MHHIILAGYIDKKKKNGKGIFQKMVDQSAGFKKTGLTADLVCIENGQLFIKDHSKSQGFYRVRSRSQFYLGLYRHIQKNKTDILYLRYPFATWSLWHFLRQMKHVMPGIQIVMEWPTFPYEAEFKGLKKLKYWIDQYFQKKILTFLDLAVVIGQTHTFKHVPTLNITNGYQCRAMTIDAAVSGNKNQWVAVGFWQDWHGLERLILGLHRYYTDGGTQMIQLKVIGDGPALNLYKRLVKRLSLQDTIHFFGSISEKETKAIISESSLGIGVLGSYKKNLNHHAPLKHRMYACAGLPFVYSTSDADFDDQPYIFQVPDNDNPINFPALLSWANQQKFLKTDIMMASKDRLDWANRCQAILDMLIGINRR